MDSLDQKEPNLKLLLQQEAPLWLIENLVEASKNARGIFYLYLSFSAYLLLTVIGTTDKQLLIGGTVQLPIINMQVPLIGFFVSAPILLIVVFTYFQLYLLRIQTLKRDLCNFKPLAARQSYPWMINMAEDPDPGLVGKLQRVIVVLVLWPIVPIVLFFAQIWVLKKQDIALSFCLTAEFLFGLFVVFSFWKLFKLRSTMLTNIVLFIFLAFGILVVGYNIINPGCSLKKLFELKHLELPFQKLINDENEKYPSLPLVDLQKSNLKYANLKSTVLNRADLDSAHLEHANLIAANLQNANLFGVHLEYANLIAAFLDSADLDSSYLGHANLSGAHLRYANLSGAHLEYANLSDAHLEYANLSGAYLDSASLTRADLEHANLSSAHLGRTNLAGANLEHADLSEANIGHAFLLLTHLREANLAYADLDSANLHYADLDRANLSGARFSGAHLFGARLDSTNLTGAHLDHANLAVAHLEYANLKLANLEGANLSGAHLEYAFLNFSDLINTNLTHANFYHAILDSAFFFDSNISDSGLDLATSFYNAVFDTSLIQKFRPNSTLWKKWKYRLMSLRIDDSLGMVNYDSLQITVFVLSNAGIATNIKTVFHGPFTNNYQLSRIWFDEISPLRSHIKIKGYRKGICLIELNDSATLYYDQKK